MTSELSREDLETILAVRHEKGPDYDAALIDSFMAKLDSAVKQRTRAEIDARYRPRTAKSGQLALSIVSLVLAVPLTAIGGDMAGLIGVLVVWIGIGIINIVYGWGGGQQPGR